MVKGIFVTATATDAGKTYISALLVKRMLNLGFNCGYYKPALSGTVDGIPGDCDFVIKTSGLKASPLDCVSYAFEPAVSPHLASRIENNPINLNKIISDFENYKKVYDYVVVEGAGGIVCPFNLIEGQELLLPDVIKALNLDVIIVADAGLGTINSTVLTVEYANSCGINVRGIILNNYDENILMHSDNKIQIEKLTGKNVIALVKQNDSEININNIEKIFKEI